ncbi:MAG TPA: 30S ribosomal protein S2 [Rubrobacter sp.]|nr:30S ribosomal protein S2 [Rubrobacter sp.]
MDSTTERVGIRELLEAGVHFGHQAKRWNPKMKRYIFAQRTGVHIIDLDQTITLLERALKFIRGVAEANKDVLFVGTKKQAQIPLAEQAMRSGQPYVAERYIGGMLTNFQTILPRIQYFTDLAQRVEETPEEAKTGKDWFALNREYQKLRRNFAGLTEMERLPGAIFVVDPKREELMVKEANRLKIPVVALTDTNCDPEVVDYVVPGNDDAIRSIGLISRLVADAIVAGRGEEVPAEDRPLPPVIEEAQANEEVEAAKASSNGNGATAAPAEPEAETPAATAEPASGDTPPNGAQSAAEPVTEPADEAAAEEPVAEPAEDPVAEEPAADEVPVEDPVAEEPVAEEPVAETPAAEEPVAGEESSEGASAEAGQENEQSEES